MKTCSGCQQTKPKSEFYPRKNRLAGVESKCKECYRTYKVNYRLNNKEIIRAQNKKRVPGWSLDRYNEHLNAQSNSCAICKEVLSTKKDLCQDHNHLTNQPRGLLCIKCNAGLGYFQDNLEYLKSAIAYLDKWS